MPGRVRAQKVSRQRSQPLRLATPADRRLLTEGTNLPQQENARRIEATAPKQKIGCFEALDPAHAWIDSQVGVQTGIG